jgi:hypothetical protein
MHIYTCVGVGNKATQRWKEVRADMCLFWFVCVFLVSVRLCTLVCVYVLRCKSKECSHLRGCGEEGHAEVERCTYLCKYPYIDVHRRTQTEHNLSTAAWPSSPYQCRCICILWVYVHTHTLMYIDTHKRCACRCATPC